MNSPPNHNNSAKVSGTKRGPFEKDEDLIERFTTASALRKRQRVSFGSDYKKRFSLDTHMEQDALDIVNMMKAKVDCLIQRVNNLEQSGKNAYNNVTQFSTLMNNEIVELDLKKMSDIREVNDETEALLGAEYNEIKAKEEEDKELQRQILMLQDQSVAIREEIKALVAEKPGKIAKIKGDGKKEIDEIKALDKSLRERLEDMLAERVNEVVGLQLQGQKLAEIDIPGQVAELRSFLERPCVARDNAHQASIQKLIASLEALISGIETNAGNVISDAQHIPCSTLRQLFRITSVEDIVSLPVRQVATGDSKSFNAVEPIVTYLRERKFECHPQYKSVWTENKEFQQFARDSGIPASWQHALPPSINNLNKPQWHKFLCFILDISEDDE